MNLKVIKEDLLTKNYRKVLNQGYTIGHALWYFMQKGTPIKHGIAIAAGMFCEIEILLICSAAF